jgi:heterodisulfide reductase subunit A
MVPSAGADEVAAMFGVGRDKDNWLVEAHAKLRPVETNTAGV